MPETFELGKIVITRNAQDTLVPQSVPIALKRHSNCDWGEVDDEDKAANNQALKDGSRLLSAYLDHNNVKFWIITEADRSVTTILLPEDY
jgi:hypothetical protein